MNAQTGQQSFVHRYFKLDEKHTTVKTELIAGFTTFIALAYIMFVNPNILAEAGIPKEAAIASTIWIAAIATMAMGVVANYPVALAPGMGLNAFFAYYVVGVLHLHWTVALGAVFFSGIFFLILTIGGIRQAIINAVPTNLKIAIGVGIGMFIAFIGLKGTGLVIPDKATFVGLGHVTEPTTMLSLFGLLLTAALIARRVQGAILIGILATTVLSMCLGYSPVPHGIGDIISSSMPSMGATFGELDIAGAWNYAIVGVRDQIQYETLREATLQSVTMGDNKPLSLAENDMIAIKATMRLGFLPVKENAFAILTPKAASTSSTGN